MIIYTVPLLEINNMRAKKSDQTKEDQENIDEDK